MKSFGITFVGGTMLALGGMLVPEVLTHAGRPLTMLLLALWIGLSVAIICRGIRRQD